MGHSVFNEQGLFFIPLGGSEQFGMNLNVYVCDGEMMVVDCGLGFAGEDIPGIDILLPDPRFIEEHKEHLKGLIITHAHEDHIGAVAHLWERMECPLYASPFTAAVLYKKLEERGLKRASITIVEPGSEVEIGSFGVQFVPVSHSVPDTCSLIVETGYGRVVHSGDWNLDPSPVLGLATDSAAFQAAGAAGVLAYIGDSTNAEVGGYSGSEADVAKGLEAEFRMCQGRIAVTSFSSNIGRVISIMRAAEACGRSVAVMGRSLHRMTGCARDLGMLDGLPDFVSEEALGDLPHDKVVVIVTGSQGEARAALAKIARGQFKGFELNRGDSVIFSARAIPGNETGINQVKNHLSAGGVRVVTPRDTNNVIHVSGHPCREEIGQMLQWLKPEIVVPVHGERMQIDAHAAFARECQVSQVVVPSNGSVIRLAPGQAERIDHVEVNILAVDQRRVIDVDHASIIERRRLQYSGAVYVSVVLDDDGALLDDPQLSSMGLIDIMEEEGASIEEQAYDAALDAFEGLSRKDRRDDALVEDKVRRAVRRSFRNALGLKPNVTVHIMRL